MIFNSFIFFILEYNKMFFDIDDFAIEKSKIDRDEFI
jgi:hypothetical protein